MKPTSEAVTSLPSSGDSGMTYAAEAVLTQREGDGSVAGSYPAETMDRLLRYHPGEYAAATGQVVVAGEVVEG